MPIKEAIYNDRKFLIKKLLEIKNRELSNQKQSPRRAKTKLEIIYEIISLISTFDNICSNHEQYGCKSISDGNKNVPK